MNAVTELKPRRTWREGKAKLLATIASLESNVAMLHENLDGAVDAYQDAERRCQQAIRSGRRFAGWYAAAAFAFGLVLGMAAL